jgi:DNA transposition AAA+ family ATPase
VDTSVQQWKVLEKVIKALDSSKLIIVDEVHRLFTLYKETGAMKVLDTFRYIHDQTKCGLLLCGTDIFRDNLQYGRFVKYLTQLQRRASCQVQLPQAPPREDIDLMCSKFGLPPADGDAEEVVLDLTRREGFGKFKMRLVDACGLAARKKQKVTWNHFIRAHALINEMAKG